MRQAGLLVAVFVVTLTMLTGLFFVLRGGEAVPIATPAATATPGPTIAPTPPPTARPTAGPTAAPATPEPSATASGVPTPSVQPTPRPTLRPTPAATVPPTGAPASVDPSGRIVVVELGVDYVNADVPSHGSITPGSDGSITLRTDRTVSYQLEVEWQLPDGTVPAGRTVRSIEVRICGVGNGDFWETYGPDGSDPMEHEVAAPEPDGCWHYRGAPGPDSTVKAIIRLASTLTIRTVEYTVTLAP